MGKKFIFQYGIMGTFVMSLLFSLTTPGFAMGEGGERYLKRKNSAKEFSKELKNALGAKKESESPKGGRPRAQTLEAKKGNSITRAVSPPPVRTRAPSSPRSGSPLKGEIKKVSAEEKIKKETAEGLFRSAQKKEKDLKKVKEAVNYYLDAAEIYKEISDKEKAITCYENAARAAEKLGVLLSIEDFYQEIEDKKATIKDNEDSEKKSLKATNYCLVARLLLKKTDQVLFYKKAEKLYNEIGEKEMENTCATLIGVLESQIPPKK